MLANASTLAPALPRRRAGRVARRHYLQPGMRFNNLAGQNLAASAEELKRSCTSHGFGGPEISSDLIADHAQMIAPTPRRLPSLDRGNDAWAALRKVRKRRLTSSGLLLRGFCAILPRLHWSGVDAR